MPPFRYGDRGDLVIVDGDPLTSGMTMKSVVVLLSCCCDNGDGINFNDGL